jgi:hypothetical protein
MFDYLIATILSALSHTASFVGIDMPREDATAQHVERGGEDAFTFGISSRGEGSGEQNDMHGGGPVADDDLVDPTLERDILRALDQADAGAPTGMRTGTRAGLAVRGERDDARGWDDEGEMEDEVWDDRGGEDDDEYDDRGSRGIAPGAVPVPKPVVTPTPKPVVSAGVTLATLAQHASATDCWVGYNGTAYDITKIIAWHPGGPGAITPYCGTSAKFTNAFARKHGTRMVSILLSMASNKGALAQ